MTAIPPPRTLIKPWPSGQRRNDYAANMGSTMAAQKQLLAGVFWQPDYRQYEAGGAGWASVLQ